MHWQLGWFMEAVLFLCIINPCVKFIQLIIIMGLRPVHPENKVPNCTFRGSKEFYWATTLKGTVLLLYPKSSLYSRKTKPPPKLYNSGLYKIIHCITEDSAAKNCHWVLSQWQFNFCTRKGTIRYFIFWECSLYTFWLDLVQ